MTNTPREETDTLHPCEQYADPRGDLTGTLRIFKVAKKACTGWNAIPPELLLRIFCFAGAAVSLETPVTARLDQCVGGGDESNWRELRVAHCTVRSTCRYWYNVLTGMYITTSYHANPNMWLQTYFFLRVGMHLNYDPFQKIDRRKWFYGPFVRQEFAESMYSLYSKVTVFFSRWEISITETYTRHVIEIRTTAAGGPWQAGNMKIRYFLVDHEQQSYGKLYTEDIIKQLMNDPHIVHETDLNPGETIVSVLYELVLRLYKDLDYLYWLRTNTQGVPRFVALLWYLHHAFPRLFYRRIRSPYLAPSAPLPVTPRSNKRRRIATT